MIRNAHEEGISASDSAILRVLEKVAARRLAGEDLSDDAVIADHTDLLPDLRDRLQALRIAENARRLATESASFTDESVSGGIEYAARRPYALEPDAFQGYELGDVVGHGAMGVVYRATQAGTRRDVAIKVMLQGPFDGASDQERFEREARMLGRLRHPNIVTVHDTGWSRGRFYLVMDYVAGEALDVFLRRRVMPLRETLALLAEIAEAVHAAHLNGVIHRDLKPSNILIDATGRPHLLDFGLAKAVSGASNGELPDAYARSMTMTGQFVGSLPWASPEQAEGAPDKIDIRTDVYSLGVILFQALTGKFPYSVVGNLRDVIDRILTSEPVAPRNLVSTVDDEVETIVLKCLSKERERRYQGAGELAQDIRRYLAGETIEAKRDSAWYVLRKSLYRHRAAAAVAAGFVILTMVYGVTMSVLYRDAQREAHRAQQTLTFLQETLFQASSQRLGSGATLLEALDAASARLPLEFADQPSIEAALQFTLGSAYESVWQKKVGAEHLRRSLELSRAVNGPNHPDTLRALVSLGMVLAEMGDPESVGLEREALALRTRLHGSESKQTADGKGDLAFALWAAAHPPQWNEAQREYEEALELYHKTVGTESSEIARMITGWAAMNHARGRSAEAESQYREALGMSQRLLGDTHQFTIECRLGLADLFAEQGRNDAAQEILDAVLPLADRVFGARSLPQIVRRKAYVQIARGDFAEAEKTLSGVQASACDRMSIAYPEAAEKLRTLSVALQQSSGKGAMELYLNSVRTIHALSPNPFEAARTVLAFGVLRYKQGSFAAAEPFFRECLAYLPEIPTGQLSIRVLATRNLCSCLIAQDQSVEAETLLLGIHAALCSTVGDEDDLAQSVLSDLISLYEKTGRTEQAEALRSRVIAKPAS
jgi:tetratricopeptide (TPR) repeat protein